MVIAMKEIFRFSSARHALRPLWFAAVFAVLAAAAAPSALAQAPAGAADHSGHGADRSRR